MIVSSPLRRKVVATSRTVDGVGWFVLRDKPVKTGYRIVEEESRQIPGVKRPG
jgi:hypothetical protein